MKRTIRILGSVGVGLLVVACACMAQSGPRYILRANPSNQADICNSYGLVVLEQGGTPQVVIVTGPNSEEPGQLVTEVRSDPMVQGFELETGAAVVEAATNNVQNASPNALSSALNNLGAVKFYGNLVWNAYINQPALTQIDMGHYPGQPLGSGVVVAVIDTGVDPTHPALKGVLLPGYDFTRNQPGGSELSDVNQSTVAVLGQSTVAVLNQSTVAVLGGYAVTQLNQSTVAVLGQSTVAVLNSNPLPSEFGHGTMVAGLIHLVAPGARIMPLKAFSADGTAELGDVVRAIYYAVNNGANVINMSFSQEEISSEMLLAINYAVRSGVICVASVGNNASKTAVYPASIGNVFGVGSVSATGALSTFSNHGPDLLTLVAPGEGLITTYPGAQWAAVWGTSFSSALVSGNMAVGVASLNQNNPLNFDDTDDAMASIASVNPYNTVTGWGVLDVRNMSKFNQSGFHFHTH
ncbi:MAG TPA: S8 family serine peptidase [Terriglobia bacterium]|nr:S8 family serine peptidase [Terriglobia bacterium]